MKKYLIVALVAMSACGNTNNKPENTDPNRLSTSIVSNPNTADGVDAEAAAMKPTMDFTDTVHDFSILHEGEVVSYDFEFTNNGKSPLIITSANGSCGCTIPQYPHEPVAPGQKGTMKVTFNSAGKSGPQEKSVEIRTNTLRSVQMLFIKAEVKKQ